MRTFEYIVLHHSFTKDNKLLADSIAIRKYHMQVNGWNDIGYHFIVERVVGMLTTSVGRALKTIGAHCKEAGMNSKSIGICVVGNFDEAPPDLDTMIHTAKLCRALMKEKNIQANKVIKHRDAGLMAGYDWRKVGPTGVREFKTCPGILWPEDLMRQMLAGIYKPHEEGGNA